MADLSIREMTLDDVPAAVAIMDAGGWHGRGHFWEWALTVPTIDAYVGLLDGHVVATGMGTNNGPIGWVGSIFVDASLRRHGYGRAITEAVCDRLESRGCETLALIASDLGRPVYREMGFRVDGWYQIWEAPTLPSPDPVGRAGGSDDAVVRPASRDDVAAIAALDRKATGEDRTAVLAALIDRTWVLPTAAGGGGEIRGFLAQERAESGTVIASKPGDAALLLRHLRAVGHGRVERVRAAVPRPPDGEVRPEARQLLGEAGWTPAFETPRMLRGPSPVWDPTLIWGILGFSFG
jgi:GNAT superfamily N-acetyltransferase